MIPDFQNMHSSPHKYRIDFSCVFDWLAPPRTSGATGNMISSFLDACRSTGHIAARLGHDIIAGFNLVSAKNLASSSVCERYINGPGLSENANGIHASAIVDFPAPVGHGQTHCLVSESPKQVIGPFTHGVWSGSYFVDRSEF